MLRSTWEMLGRYLPHRTRRFLSISALALVAALLEAGVLVLTVRAAVAIAEETGPVTFDPVLAGELTASIPTLLWVAAASCLLSVAASMGVAALTARAASDVLAQTRAATLRAFIRASWPRQAESPEGAVQEAVSTNAIQAVEVTVAMTRGLTAGISLAALLGTALAVSVVATAAVILMGVVIVVLLRPITRSTRGRAATLVDSNRRYAESVAESTALTMELRVFGVEDVEIDRLSSAAAETGRRTFLTRFASDTGTTVYRGATVLFLVAAVGGLYALGSIDLHAVGAVVVLVVRTVSYAQQVQAYQQRLQEFTPNLAALDARIRDFEAAREQVGDREVASVGTISLRQVGYAYGDEAEALHGIDLEIRPGETLGVVGPSGGGKTTLVQVLLRLRRPTTGAVVVDGEVPYEDIDPACWSRLVSMVPQEPRLFAGTVADNIAFHRRGLTREQIVAAAELAHVADEVARLPHGFDTVLGPRGSGLSGGQRQRLAIARALVGEPSVLVLDEPTSALDVHSERLLQQTIAELAGRVTMVIVAHRLSTIAACERLLVLEHGRIAALGPPEEVRRHPFLRRATDELRAPSAAS